MEKVDTYYNHRTNMWEVRLQETISEPLQRDAENTAKIKLAAYHEAGKCLTTPLQIFDAILIQQNKQLQAENEKLKTEKKQFQAENEKLKTEKKQFQAENEKLKEALTIISMTRPENPVYFENQLNHIIAQRALKGE